MPPRGAPVDDRRRYDLYLSAAPPGTILPAAGAASSASAGAGVDAGALASAVFDAVNKRASQSGRSPSLFYAPRSVKARHAESLDATLQTRGGGVPLFILTTAFFRSNKCVNELERFLHVQESARHGEETDFRLVCAGTSPDELRRDVAAQVIMPRLAEYKLHVVALSTLPAMTDEIVKLVPEVCESASISNALGATRHDSLVDLLRHIPEADLWNVANVLGVEAREGTTLGEIVHSALSSRKLGSVGDSELLQKIVTWGCGLQAESKHMAVEAYCRKWESSDSWEWGASARDDLELVPMSVPELHAADVEAPARAPRMIAPENPAGVHLDYNDASTPEGKLKRALLGAGSSSEMVAATSFSPRLTSAHGMGGVGKTCALRGLVLIEMFGDDFPTGCSSSRSERTLQPPT